MKGVLVYAVVVLISSGVLTGGFGLSIQTSLIVAAVILVILNFLSIFNGNNN